MFKKLVSSIMTIAFLALAERYAPLDCDMKHFVSRAFEWTEKSGGSGRASSAVSEPDDSWTPEALVDDPEEVANLYEEKVRDELTEFNRRRDSLGGAVNDLARMLEERETLYNQGLATAEELAALLEANVFPVEFCGASYSKEELEAQLSLTLAEIDGLRSSIKEIRETGRLADCAVEKLVVHSETLDTNLRVLKTRGEVLKTNKLVEADRRMVDALKNALDAVDDSSNSAPGHMRDIEALLKNDAGTFSNSSQERIEKYMADFRKRKESQQ